MAEYTPEWQEQHTTVPPETIRRVARDFVAAADVQATITLDGVEFPLRPGRHQVGTRRLLDHPRRLPALRRQDRGRPGRGDGRPRGFLGSEQGPALSPGPDGVVAPKQEAQPVPWQVPPSIDLREYYPHRHTGPYLAWRACSSRRSTGSITTSTCSWSTAATPSTRTARPLRAIEAFKKIPFMVEIAFLYDETTQFCDILLPESSVFERYGLLEYGDHVVHAADEAILRTRTLQVSKPVIEPVWNTRQADDMYIEIAERAGFLYGETGLNAHINRTLDLCDEHKLDLDKKYLTPDLIDRVARCHYGEEYGLDYFDEHALIPDVLSKAQAYNFYWYPWGTTRHPLYFNQFYANGAGAQEEPGRHRSGGASRVGLRGVLEALGAHPSVGGPLRRGLRGGVRPAGHGVDHAADPHVRWRPDRQPLGAGAGQGLRPLRLLASSSTPRPHVAKGSEGWRRVKVEAFWGGSTEGVLKLTELIHPDALGFPGHHGFKGRLRNPITWEGPDFNDLLSDRDGEFDPISCATDISPRVRITRVGAERGRRAMRYGMVIDLDKCRGCMSCDVACKRRTSPRRVCTGARNTSTRPALSPQQTAVAAHSLHALRRTCLREGLPDRRDPASSRRRGVHRQRPLRRLRLLRHGLPLSKPGC